MLKDIFCYIKMSIRGELETDGGKKKIKYPFQKIAIVIALALWTITAINILYSESALSGEERIISAFGRQTYSDVSSSVSAYGKYGDISISDSAKKLILENIAEKIGINHYMISDLVDEEYNSVKTLSQTSVNGDVILKFITHDEDKQYIYIGITLKNGIESAFTYEKIVKQILKDLEMTSAVNVNLKGEINGKLDIQEKNALADSLLGEVGAKIVTQNRTDDLYVIYGYDDEIDEYINVGRGKVNVCISVNYDEIEDVTCVYFSTPMNNQDFCIKKYKNTDIKYRYKNCFILRFFTERITI